MAHLLRRTRTARPSLRRAALVRARRAAAPFLLAALLCPAPAQGGGFELPVLGPAGVGRGGAVTASVEDLTAAELNPAGLARLKGTHTMLAAGPLYNQLRYRRAPLYDWSRATSNSPPPVVQYGEIENENGMFWLSGSFFGLASDLGLPGWMFAATVHGPTEIGDFTFPEDGPQRYMMVDRDVMLAFYSLAAAWQPVEGFGLGVSLQWVDCSRLYLRMVTDADNQTHIVYPDASPYDVLVTIDAADRVGMTATAGTWWRPFPWLELGLAGRLLPVAVDTEGTMEIEGTGDMLRGKTLVLGRPGPGDTLIPDDRASVSFDYAPSARAGLRWLLRRGEQRLLDLELDLTWEGWSVMEAYRVKSPPLARVEELDLEVALDEMVVQRSWEDVYGVRLGGELQLLPELLGLRAGGFYETGAVPDERTYLDFLSYARLGLGGGLWLALGAVRVELAYQHVFVEPRAVSEEEGKMYQMRPGSLCKAPYAGEACDPHYLGQPGATANAGTFLAGYDLFSLGVALDWGKLLEK